MNELKHFMNRKNILIMIFFITLSTFAQQEVLFKIKIQPNKYYSTNLKTFSNFEIDILANETILQRFVLKGIKLPMIATDSTVVPTEIFTYKPLENGTFNAKIQYGDVFKKKTLNGELQTKKNQFSGVKILGTYNVNSKFKIDTIIGQRINQQLKTSLSAILENAQELIKFPEKPLKVGESFENELPTTIPMEGFNPIKIIIKSNYLLTEINNGIAYFDVNQAIKIDMIQEQLNLKANGSGVGKSEYNIEEMYLTKYSSDISMNFSMKVKEEISTIVKAETSMNFEVTIRPFDGIAENAIELHSQKLTCADFKTGRFYIPENVKLAKISIISKDSLNSKSNELTFERDPSIKKYVVIREKNTQVEWKNGVNNGNPEHEIIEWIDECTYRLTYNKNKSVLNDEKKWVNENNGIVVKKIRIIGKCMEYKATMTTKEGHEVSQNGTICKD